MKYIFIAIVLASLSACYFAGKEQETFFGARVDSEYIMHYNNKLQCAYVIGWYDERKCMCFLTEDDLRLKDKTLIASNHIMCLTAE